MAISAPSSAKDPVAQESRTIMLFCALSNMSKDLRPFKNHNWTWQANKREKGKVKLLACPDEFYGVARRADNDRPRGVGEPPEWMGRSAVLAAGAFFILHFVSIRIVSI